MGLQQMLRELRWRAAGHYSRPLPDDFTAPMRGARGLEIGGPSAVFGAAGLLPVYPLLAAIDGVQWAAETAWHKLEREHGYRPEGEPRGELHVIDGVDLAGLPDGGYDVVFSSHVIEHLANPLRALAAWRRVTRAERPPAACGPPHAGHLRPPPLAHLTRARDRRLRARRRRG